MTKISNYTNFPATLNRGNDGIVSVLYAIYKCKNVVPEYIDYYFGYSDRINKYLKPIVNVGAKHTININNLDVLENCVTFPEIKEQEKIVDFLTQIDASIIIQEKKLNFLSKRKKGLLNKIIDKTIGFENDIEWKTGLLGDFFEERNEKAKGDETLLSVTISNGVIMQSESFKDDNSSENKKNYKIVRKYDIAYNTMRMWQGSEGMSEYDGIVSPAYTVLKPKKGTLSQYFSIIFKSDKYLQLFTSYSQGLSSDNWNLKFDIFKDLEIEIPEIKEQEKIVEFFNLLIKQIDLETEKLLKLKELKKGLLQQMFC